MKVYKIECDKRKKDLESYKKAYDKCQANRDEMIESGLGNWFPFFTFLGGVAAGMVVKHNER